MIKRKPLLALAIASFVLAFVCILACVTHAGNSNAGASGGAAGFGIIASTFILCGSFFLYKHLTNKNM